MPDIVPLSTGPIRPFSLSSPVRLLARPTLWVEPEDTLALASSRFLQNGSDVLPVVSDGKLVAMITGRGLTSALGDAVEFSDAVKQYQESPHVICSYATGAEALRAFVGGEPLFVVDDESRLIGVISPADLFPKYRAKVRPLSLTGMPTPLGVYFSGGTVTAGVNNWGLVLAGATIGTIICAAGVVAGLLGFWLHNHGLHTDVAYGIVTLTFFLLTAGCFKLFFSGYHGAEHQVINAIDRELQLTPDVVRRMPRYHARCGTNYSVAVLLFITAFSINWVDSELIRLTAAAWLTLILWRPVSAFAQNFLTTSKPTDAQLDQAISAGEDLLDRYAKAKSSYPKASTYFWNSGLPFLLTGLLPVCLLIGTLVYLLKLNIF